MDISSPISEARGISPNYLKKLNKLGVKTVRDLLYHIPHRYEDFSHLVKIGDLAVGGEPATVQGKIVDIKNVRSWKKRMFITEALVEDDTGGIKAVWFNQPYLVKNLRKGMLVNLSGKISLSKKSLAMIGPAYEIVGQSVVSRRSSVVSFKHTAGLIPVYPVTGGLTSRALRFFIKPLLRFTYQIPDILPYEIKKKQKLLDLKTALWQIHFPKTMEMAREAKRRLAFEEMFLWQLTGLAARKKLKKAKAPAVRVDIDLAKRFVSSLPFKLTDSQRVSAWQILKDLEKDEPMNRLLQGDVGSGKTVVAALAALMAVKSGGQAAFMAPTEILAQQHFRTLCKVLAPFEVAVGLLTASQSLKSVSGEITDVSKKNLISETASGLIEIIVGTHALIQKSVSFKNLFLAVIDEQHRFGVEQRASLSARINADINADKRGYIGENQRDNRRESARIPHLLSMTATPIPRTLALTVYGDLDISLIKELPPGRQRIITEIVSPSARKKTYEFIRRQIKEGRQAFVICPRIEILSTDDRLPSIEIGSRNNEIKAEWPTADGRWQNRADVKAVKEEYEKLKKEIFPDLNVGMLHGRLPGREKEKTMNRFANGEIDILVSTSVIEVGIDVPNATIMVVEGAERFGLAQLHQFRGRVGRGTHQSHCFLFTGSASRLANERLKALQKCENGFELAEKDLQLRGPGDFYGIRQSGLPDLVMSSLADVFLVEAARHEAQKILDEDPELKKHPLLGARISEFKKAIHFE